MSDTDTLDLAALLDLLGHELVALCWKKSNGVTFNTLIDTPTEAAAMARSAALQESDVWFSINEPAGPPGRRPRGDATDVTRLTALWADLDIKPGAFTDEVQAHAVIDDLAAILGQHPIAVTHSGHGLQPIWSIDHHPLDNNTDRAAAVTLLGRWRRLVETVAGHRGATVDAVFDLPRILRAPGTINWKDTPVPTSCEARPGAPITVDTINEVLDEYGVAALQSDVLLEQPVDTSTWTWADETCPYAQKLIAGWLDDNPPARHPWLMSQVTRLAIAHRYSCLTEADYRKAVTTLEIRMQELCATGNTRALAQYEVRDALAWGEHQAALKPDGSLARELGGHTHNPQLTIIDGGDITALTATPLPATGTDPAVRNLAAAGEPLRVTLTDDGNARQFVHQHGHHLRYSAARGWLAWDGTRWKISEDDAPAIGAARDVAAGLPEDSKEKARHKAKTLGRAGIENMVALARRDPVIRVTADQLDAHRMQLNTPTGTLDLTTGDVHDHRPGELHTKITAVGIDTTMATPRWRAFLRSTFGDDDELIGFVQRLLGYAATGHVTHHVLPFLHGTGGNGKSVLTNVLAGVLGDYAIMLPSSVLIAQRYSHDTELARLAGVRVAIASEVPTEGRFDEERVKMLTGGDRITARRLYHDPFEFAPSHTLILSGNHQPAVESGGDSFWRRLRLIPFTRTVPKNERVDGLDQLLIEEEGPGILAWITQGALAAANGLGEPDSVMAATKAYEAEEDSFGQFITDCLHVAEGSDIVKVKTTDLRKAYSSWCKDNGRSEMSAQAFSREIRRRVGARAIKSHGTRYYAGIALIDVERNDEADRRYGA